MILILFYLPIARRFHLPQCKRLRSLEFKLGVSPRSESFLAMCFRASLDIMRSIPQHPFKLTLRFGYFFIGGVSRYVNTLSRLDWGKFREFIARHPCRVNGLTINLGGSTTYRGYERVEKLLKDELKDLDSDGLLEIIHRYG